MITQFIESYTKGTGAYSESDSRVAERHLLRTEAPNLLFRRRLALATARLCPGASTEAMDALPPLEISLSPDVAAARAFSRTMRWYSAGEHLFCATSSMRRAIVSHDAIIRSVIIIGSDTALRRLRALMTNPSPMTNVVQCFQIIGRFNQCRHAVQYEACKTEFAADSALEGAGFEPSVPRLR